MQMQLTTEMFSQTNTVTRPPDRARALRDLLVQPELAFLMEAHNGISARIAEQAGFKAIWASGLSLSAQFGVRDNNEASWTQIVDMLEFMSDATEIPILLDGDTGYGNFNNVRRLIRKLEQRNIAGVCIEDKLYPKTNSFIRGRQQPLADIQEFQGKIKAGKDCQEDDDFCIVARIEALVAGWGMDEALRRAEAYHAAGADAILIHSTRPGAQEIVAFCREWGRRCPIVIVPTTYFGTPVAVFREAGVSAVIWANQLLRSAVAAMQDTARELYQTQTLVNVEDRIAPLGEVFRLQGTSELLEAENRYLTGNAHVPHAIVLAASRGDNLGALTAERPKVMLPIAGQPLLRRLVDQFKQQSIHEITVVTGYKPESVEVNGATLIHNPLHDSSGELTSLDRVRSQIGKDVLITYGDLLFRSYILRDLLEMPGDIVIVADAAPLPDDVDRRRDLVYCTIADDHALLQQDVELRQMRSTWSASMPAPHGRWIGMLFARENGSTRIREALTVLSARPDFAVLGLPDLLNHLVKTGCPVKVMYIQGHWLDVNDEQDLRHAYEFTRGSSQQPAVAPPGV